MGRGVTDRPSTNERRGVDHLGSQLLSLDLTSTNITNYYPANIDFSIISYSSTVRAAQSSPTFSHPSKNSLQKLSLPPLKHGSKTNATYQRGHRQLRSQRGSGLCRNYCSRPGEATEIDSELTSKSCIRERKQL